MKYLSGILLIICLCECKGRYYEIPTSSMENTIMLHDRIYVTPSQKFMQNDVVVFDLFGDDYLAGPDENGAFKKHWEKRVCRLIALSGDSLQIKNDDLYLNGQFVSLPPKGKQIYNVYCKSIIEEFDPEGIYGIYPQRIDNRYLYQVPLSKDEVIKYQANKEIVDSVVQHIDPPGYFANDTVFARPVSSFQWNACNYGPLYIPRPGETILVNDENFKLYQNIPGITKGRFRITEPLYFVMGDNRHMAQDSRYVGFISHSNMYGVVK